MTDPGIPIGPLLADKVAIVTGGAGGIGQAISELFARHGAIVAVVDIDAPRTEETVARIEARGGRAGAHPVDVRDRAALHGVVDATVRDHGRLDVVVNNVGHFLFPGRSFVDLSLIHISEPTRPY